MEALALQAAQLAVQRDREGRWAEAVQQYDSCVGMLESLGKPEHRGLLEDYKLRSRLLKLRVFEQNKNTPSVSERLKELRGGKDSPVPVGRVVFQEEEEAEEDEDRILVRVQAELALEAGEGTAPRVAAAVSSGSSPSCSSSEEPVSPDNSDDDGRMRAMKAKARAEHTARKQRAKKRLQGK